MYKICYHYTYKGEQKERVETLEKVLNKEEVERARSLLCQLPQMAIVFINNVREVMVAVSAYTLPDGRLPEDDLGFKTGNDRNRRYCIVKRK